MHACVVSYLQTVYGAVKTSLSNHAHVHYLLFMHAMHHIVKYIGVICFDSDIVHGPNLLLIIACCSDHIQFLNSKIVMRQTSDGKVSTYLPGYSVRITSL